MMGVIIDTGRAIHEGDQRRTHGTDARTFEGPAVRANNYFKIDKVTLIYIFEKCSGPGPAHRPIRLFVSHKVCSLSSAAGLNTIWVPKHALDNISQWYIIVYSYA